MMTETTRPTDLLRALDACVRRESARSGLNGTIAVGVRGTDGESWWTASFGATTTRTDHAASRPPRADVALLLGSAEADALLGARALPSPAPLIELEGDPVLLRRFLDRYLRQTNMLALRAGTPTSSARPTTTSRRRPRS